MIEVGLLSLVGLKFIVVGLLQRLASLEGQIILVFLFIFASEFANVAISLESAFFMFFSLVSFVEHVGSERLIIVLQVVESLLNDWLLLDHILLLRLL